MSKEDIESLIASIEAKIANIKEMLDDMSKCSNQQSKTILLAAAGKLMSEFKTTTAR